MKLHKAIPAGMMFILLTAFCLCGRAEAASGVIELSYSTVFPPTHIHAKLGESWIKEIESRTQGRVKINFYPGGALLKGDKMYSGVQTGIADIGMSVFVYNRGMYPVMEIVDLPLGFTSGKMGTTVINEIYKKFPPKKLDREVEVLYLHAHGPGLLHTKKPITNLEDIKGLKIRGQGATARIIESLGAVPVAMPQAQSYEALQKGVVEGNFSPMEVLKGWRQADVVNHTTLCYGVGYSSTFYLIMNKRKWDAIPDDIKKIFEEVDVQWSMKHADAWDQVDQEAKEFAAAMGHQIVTLSEEENERWKQAVQPAIDEYIANAKKKGLPGDVYVETAKELISNYH